MPTRAQRAARRRKGGKKPRAPAAAAVPAAAAGEEPSAAAKCPLDSALKLCPAPGSDQLHEQLERPQRCSVCDTSHNHTTKQHQCFVCGVTGGGHAEEECPARCGVPCCDQLHQKSEHVCNLCERRGSDCDHIEDYCPMRCSVAGCRITQHHTTDNHQHQQRMERDALDRWMRGGRPERNWFLMDARLPYMRMSAPRWAAAAISPKFKPKWA